jgi:hypothetical protein
MSVIYAYRNRLTREVAGLVYLPEIESGFVHPFATLYFLGLGPGYDVVAMDGAEVAARATETGRGIIDTFTAEYEIGPPADVPDLADHPRRDVLEREAKRKGTKWPD